MEATGTQGALMRTTDQVNRLPKDHRAARMVLKRGECVKGTTKNLTPAASAFRPPLRQALLVRSSVRGSSRYPKADPTEPNEGEKGGRMGGNGSGPMGTKLTVRHKFQSFSGLFGNPKRHLTLFIMYGMKMSIHIE